LLYVVICSDVSPPGAIISRSELLRFTFNPFGVGASSYAKPTGCTCGYSYSTPGGVGASGAHFPQVFLKLLSRVASYFQFIFIYFVTLHLSNWFL